MALLLTLGAWAVLVAVGWVALSPLERGRRDALLPAAPLVGAVVLVVVLHDTTLVLSVRHGLIVVGLVLAGLAAVAHRRDPSWWRPGNRALVVLGLTLVAAVLPGFLVLGPSFATGDSNVIQPSANNDAFYYATVAQWLQENPAAREPDIGATPQDGGLPPSFATARSHLDLDLRIGQELTHAALATVLGRSPEQTWYPLTALWVLLLPSAGVAAALCFRMRRATGLVLGTATATSSLVMFQFVSQNSDSLLGTALLPLALGSVVRAVGREAVVPPLLAAASLTALVGTYTEFTPLVAPALVVAVLVRRPAGLRLALRSSVVLLLLAVAVAPLVWVRAVKSLLFLGGIVSDTYPSAFADQPVRVVLGRFLGLIGPSATTVNTLVLILGAAFVLVGLLSALVLSRRRWFYVALIGPGLFLAVYLVTVRDRPYTQQRVVQLLLPLVLLVVAAGWDVLVTVARRRRALRRRRAEGGGASRWVAATAAAGALLLIVANTATARGYDATEVARGRHVGPEFAEAAGWVRAVGGPGGADAAVLVGDFFNQLWITDALRDEPETAYPSLFVSYQLQSSYWQGEPRRWLLVDSTAVLKAPRRMVVEHNARFSLLDLSRGPAAVAVPADEFGQHTYVVLRSPSAPSQINLRGLARPRDAADGPQLPGLGETFAPGAVRSGMTVARLDVPGAGVRVDLSNDAVVFQLRRLAFGKPGDQATPLGPATP